MAGIADLRVIQTMGWREGEDGASHYVPITYTIQVLRDGCDAYEDVQILLCDEDDHPPREVLAKAKA